MLYVADCNNHRIQKLSISGEFLHMFGKLGSGQGEFKSPSAVVVDFNDRLIVADCRNCRVQVMNLDGTYIPPPSQGPGTIPTIHCIYLHASLSRASHAGYSFHWL